MCVFATHLVDRGFTQSTNGMKKTFNITSQQDFAFEVQSRGQQRTQFVPHLSLLL